MGVAGLLEGVPCGPEVGQFPRSHVLFLGRPFLLLLQLLMFSLHGIRRSMIKGPAIFQATLKTEVKWFGGYGCRCYSGCRVHRQSRLEWFPVKHLSRLCFKVIICSCRSWLCFGISLGNVTGAAVVPLQHHRRDGDSGTKSCGLASAGCTVGTNPGTYLITPLLQSTVAKGRSNRCGDFVFRNRLIFLVVLRPFVDNHWLGRVHRQPVQIPSHRYNGGRRLWRFVQVAAALVLVVDEGRRFSLEHVRFRFEGLQQAGHCPLLEYIRGHWHSAGGLLGRRDTLSARTNGRKRLLLLVCHPALPVTGFLPNVLAPLFDGRLEQGLLKRLVLRMDSF